MKIALLAPFYMNSALRSEVKDRLNESFTQTKVQQIYKKIHTGPFAGLFKDSKEKAIRDTYASVISEIRAEKKDEAHQLAESISAELDPFFKSGLNTAELSPLMTAFMNGGSHGVHAFIDAHNKASFANALDHIVHKEARKSDSIQFQNNVSNTYMPFIELLKSGNFIKMMTDLQKTYSDMPEILDMFPAEQRSLLDLMLQFEEIGFVSYSKMR